MLMKKMVMKMMMIVTVVMAVILLGDRKMSLAHIVDAFSRLTFRHNTLF